MVEAGTGSLPTKVHQEKNRNQKKLDGFFLVHFCGQTAASEFNQGHSIPMCSAPKGTGNPGGAWRMPVIFV